MPYMTYLPLKWHRGSSQREWGELISKMAEEMEWKRTHEFGKLF